jgi:hypothetical protein
MRQLRGVACKAWAVHPALRIMYVNSFARVGDAS